MAVDLGSVLSAPEGIRTPNLLIRSQMLYPLSYGRSVRAGWKPRRGLHEDSRPVVGGRIGLERRKRPLHPTSYDASGSGVIRATEA